jgi:16S rRNA (guanine527-N7)-methyltransferase
LQTANRYLAALSAEWGVPCTEDQRDALWQYASLLLRWNARINLTGATLVETLVAEHFPDSFAVASVLQGPVDVVDVGSGGGLPAIPLAILREGLTLRLVEPIAKKVAFLRTAVRELGLAGRVAVDARRAEALVAEVPASFSAAVSRATLAPPVWLGLGVDLVRPGGRVLVLASEPSGLGAVSGVEQELAKSYLGGRRWLLVFRRP